MRKPYPHPVPDGGPFDGPAVSARSDASGPVGLPWLRAAAGRRQFGGRVLATTAGQAR